MSGMIEKVGRLFMIGIPGRELDDETKYLLEEIQPLSIIFFGRNIESPKQLAGLIRDITNFLGRKPVFAIDQEGGIVTRLKEGFTVLPGPMALAAVNDPDVVYEAGVIIGREMKAVGLDWNLAPVVDINSNFGNRGIGIRSYSADADTVVQYAGRFIDGLSYSGILPCLKHFPGLGGVTADPHLELPVLSRSRKELFSEDLRPFLEIEADCWMPTHLYIPALQSRMEAVTVSGEVLTGFVRKELCYNGILLADDLNMGGVSNGGGLDEIVIKTFGAGMDVLSIAEGTSKQKRAVKILSDAIEQSSVLQQRMEESLSRISRILSPFEGELHQSPDLAGMPESRMRAIEISGRTIKKIKEDVSFPVPSEVTNVFSMKLSRLVLIEEGRDGMPEVAARYASRANAELVEVKRLSVGAEEYSALLEIAEGKRNIIFTENAHLEDGVSNFISRLAANSKSLHLIALRNPWDANIDGVENAICSYGYTREQQDALYNILINGTFPGEGE